MPDYDLDAPESTAVRVALWRALPVQVDAAPQVVEDEIGLQLVAPDEEWRQRPDMDPDFTRGFRSAIVARARFIEDLVTEEAERGVTQYVLLGAGLDNRPEDALTLAQEAGFRQARHVPLSDLATRYFSQRSDGFRPTSGEDLLVATT